MEKQTLENMNTTKSEPDVIEIPSDNEPSLPNTNEINTISQYNKNKLAIIEQS